MATGPNRKPQDKTQYNRFIEAAREAEASEEEAVFNETLKRIATSKSPPKGRRADEER